MAEWLGKFPYLIPPLASRQERTVGQDRPWPTCHPFALLALVLPAADEPVRFEKHIKPLFRRQDRSSMRFAFALWSYDDVRTHAAEIFEPVSDGSMPCNGAWPAGKLATFQRWISTGTCV